MVMETAPLEFNTNFSGGGTTTVWNGQAKRKRKSLSDSYKQRK